MCKQCIDAVKRHWPTLPEEEYYALLWDGTAFPFAYPDYIERQLKDLAERSECDLGVALDMVAEAVDEAYEKGKAEWDKARTSEDQGQREHE